MNISKKINRISLILFFLIIGNTIFSQPVDRFVKVIVAADHGDWLYKKGENVKFTISVYKNGNLVKGAKVRYEIAQERQEPIKKETITLATGTQTFDAGTMKVPGFLRCIATAEVDNKEYRNLSTAGFDPLEIQPTVENPNDFDQFWNKAIADLAKVPMDAKMTLLPEKCTEKVNVYHVNLQNYK